MPRQRLALAFLLFAIAGCTTSRDVVDGKLPPAFPNHSSDEVRMLVDGRRDSIASFKARANVSVTSPQRNARFGSTIDYRKGDSLHFNIRAMLGIQAARALVTPDSFFVYDRIKRRLYYGDIEKADSMLPIPVSSPDAFYSMLGLSFSPEENWRMRADSASYSFVSPDERIEVSVDPRYWRVTHFIEVDGDGRIVEERTYGEFDDIEGVILPRRFVLERPQEKTTASVYYTDIELNPSSLDLAFSVSENVRRVPVD